MIWRLRPRRNRRHPLARSAIATCVEQAIEQVVHLAARDTERTRAILLLKRPGSSRWMNEATGCVNSVQCGGQRFDLVETRVARDVARDIERSVRTLPKAAKAGPRRNRSRPLKIRIAVHHALSIPSEKLRACEGDHATGDFMICAIIHKTSNPRAVQASVRYQFPLTSPR